ncbi:hypothetical protein [Pyrobaculum ferrireducens]|uniref:hypothetical protein n=1 Tax=Pyrobaculum ferrireducens TaxID=1104324 RepID=UPI0011E5022A|nr:hypothetical protein [Pyrobaculum ferrireducens]
MVCGLLKRMFRLAGLPEEEAEARARWVVRELASRHPNCRLLCDDLRRVYRDLSSYEVYEMCRQRHLDQVAQSADCTEPIAKSERCAPLPMASPRRVYYPRYILTDRTRVAEAVALVKAITLRFYQRFQEFRTGGRRRDVEAYVYALVEPWELDWRRVGRAGRVENLRTAMLLLLESLGNPAAESLLSQAYVYRDSVVLLGEPRVEHVMATAAAWLLFGGVYTPWPPTLAAVGEAAYRLARGVLNIYKWEDFDREPQRSVLKAYRELAQRAEAPFDDAAAEMLTALGLWGNPVVVMIETGADYLETLKAYFKIKQ